MAVQVVLHGTADGAGGFHFIAEGNAKAATATSAPSGAMYRGTGGFWDEVNATAGSTVVFADVEVFHMVSQGPGDNLNVRTFVHVTINANGDPTAVFFEFILTCDG